MMFLVFPSYFSYRYSEKQSSDENKVTSLNTNTYRFSLLFEFKNNIDISDNCACVIEWWVAECVKLPWNQSLFTNNKGFFWMEQTQLYFNYKAFCSRRSTD